MPLCALAYLFTHNVLQRLPRHDRPHQLDVLGAALMVGAAIALMLALTWGGRRYGWASPQILGLKIPVYDPVPHYQQVRDAWGGVRTPDGR